MFNNNHFFPKPTRRLVLLAITLFCGAPTAPVVAIQGDVETRDVRVPINKTQVITVPAGIARVSKGQPDIANVVLLRPNQILVQGKQVGTTNVVLWRDGDRVELVLDVEVTHDLQGLKRKLFEVLPYEQIEVRSSQGSIVLSGEVSSIESIDAALQLADSHTVPSKEKQDRGKAKVINLMHVGGAQQVMLEVKVAEVARSLLRRLDIDFSAINPSSKWTIGAVNGGAAFPDFITPEGLRVPLSVAGSPTGPPLTVFQPNNPSISAAGLFAGLVSQNWLFNLTVDAGKDNGLLKILAEPNLTTLTGQEASFLSGGEFPIPVPQSGANAGAITVEFKEFGVGVKFLPVVLDSGRINLKMNISVSEISEQSPIVVSGGLSSTSFFVPSLTLRKALSSIELGDGQTMGIAGLISNNVRENIDKFPWLGDIPGLGALFRSQSYQNDESELVIFVTPRLARPVRPDQIKLPTDDFVDPTDVEFYLMGRLEGRSADTPAAAVASGGERATPEQARAAIATAFPADPGIEGKFGHQLSVE